MKMTACGSTPPFLAAWEARFAKKLSEADPEPGRPIDPAHDLAHFRRVVATAKALASSENADWEVVVPAAWLHDLVNVPKNDPRRPQASRLSAESALEYLATAGYPRNHLEAIGHAIEAHSFSAEISPRTLEARVVQDADRLDGLGAIGIARCFAVAGLLGRRFYDPEDPFGEHRPLDDLANTVDHFYVKLFKTVETLQTRAGRQEGLLRLEYMHSFLKEIGREIKGL